MGADLSGKRQPVFARGQHEVQKNDVDRRLLQAFPHCRSVGRSADAVAFILEVAQQHLPDPRIVVDDEDMLSASLRVCHALIFKAGAPTRHKLSQFGANGYARIVALLHGAA